MASPSLLEGEDAGGKCPAHIVLSHLLLVLPLGLIQQEARGQRKALGVSHPEQGGEGGPWVSYRKRLGSHGATEGMVPSVSLYPWSPNWGTPRLSKQREMILERSIHKRWVEEDLFLLHKMRHHHQHGI